MKNVMKNIIIVIIISTCLYILRNLILTDCPYPTLNESLTNFDLTKCIIVAIIIDAIIFFYSYRKPALNEVEYKKKILEYVYASFAPEEKKIIDEMSEEDKARFTEEYLKVQKPENKTAMNNDLSKYQFPQIPDGFKPIRKILGVVIIVGIIFGGYTGWQTFSPEIKAVEAAKEAARNEIIEDQVLYIEGLPPIQLLGDNEFKKMQIEEYIEKYIKTQPKQLLQYVTMINICNERNLTNFYTDSHNEVVAIRPFAYGGQIYIRGEEEVDSKDTITHELSHVYDNVIPYDDSYYYNYVDNLDFIDYFKQNADEFMAETSSMYVNDSDDLKAQCPALYDYFASIYQ